MKQFISHITLLVHDYDEAIEFYIQKLNFLLIEDTLLSATKRWVRVAPPGSGVCSLLLAKADTNDQKNAIGKQAGGRVFLFLYTDDISRDHRSLLDHGVHIVRQPTTESWGSVLVFADLYGNFWDLIEPSK